MTLDPHSALAAGGSFIFAAAAPLVQYPPVTLGMIVLAGFGFGSVAFGYFRARLEHDSELDRLRRENATLLRRRADSGDIP